MGVFFQKRGALGKAHAERGSKAGGEPPQSIRRRAFCWDHREVLRPPYIIAPAKHPPPSFSLLKKDPHAQTLRHFQRAKVLQFFLFHTMDALIYPECRGLRIGHLSSCSIRPQQEKGD